jgi:hypothetical protein
MYHRWAALALALALCAVPTKQAAGQEASQPRGRKLGVLGQNYPNPFNPETHIPFEIVGCTTPGERAVVTIRVYNVIAQLVAIPKFEGEAAPNQPVSNLSLPCGSYSAFWDGKILNTGREAASGMYVYEVVVDGKRVAKKLFVAK